MTEQSAPQGTRWTVLEQAHDALRTVVAAVPADGWDRPTPCTQWTVAQVLQHAVGDQQGYAATITGEGWPTENPFEPSGHLALDPVALVESATRAAADAWSTVPADGPDVTTPLPVGPLAPAVGVAACALDAAVHAWDIAVATAQPSPLTPGLAAALHEAAVQFVEPLRAFAYAPVLPSADGDGPAEALLRYLGRSPAWPA
ncbi:TIGR03086 family metal-binding protein [Cellulomonas xylanilytica]|uniref:Mycothiol-dependent maleylpyruvate isomerase metal-binding domain-containing protein n=1 Tax=Cellulomonas xylanilytica TaxID=233583 RepID=A0A510UZK8_9CELL|nr:TIGR03086 family metal-binding protein [Cellulomonas xylanilytica]GEK20114.1 hypothetical protein CXY01_06340 [Cellulomonas xylanilytica]